MLARNRNIRSSNLRILNRTFASPGNYEAALTESKAIENDCKERCGKVIELDRRIQTPIRIDATATVHVPLVRCKLDSCIYRSSDVWIVKQGDLKT